MKYTLAVITVALLSGKALGQLPLSARELVARQLLAPNIEDLPDQCMPSCNPVITQLDACTKASPVDPQCICSSEIAKGLGNCFECTIAAEITPTILQDSQTAFNGILETCKGLGVELPASTLTKPGGTPTSSNTDPNSAVSTTNSGPSASTPSDAPSNTDTGAEKQPDAAWRVSALRSLGIAIVAVAMTAAFTV